MGDAAGLTAAAPAGGGAGVDDDAQPADRRWNPAAAAATPCWADLAAAVPGRLTTSSSDGLSRTLRGEPSAEALPAASGTASSTPAAGAAAGGCASRRCHAARCDGWANSSAACSAADARGGLCGCRNPYVLAMTLS